MRARHPWMKCQQQGMGISDRSFRLPLTPVLPAISYLWLSLALSHSGNPKMVREVVQLPWQDKAAALKKGLEKVKAGTQCSQV